MDEFDKDYLLHNAMVSVASFSAAAKIAKTKINNLISQPGVGDMSKEDVLKYLVDFMEEESNKMFDLYEKTLKKKVSRSTTYIELIPEAPFNPEDKESTISILRDLQKGENFHLIQVYDEKRLPKFITIDEFENNYYQYWEPVLRYFGQTEEQIENFKKGIRV